MGKRVYFFEQLMMPLNYSKIQSQLDLILKNWVWLKICLFSL